MSRHLRSSSVHFEQINQAARSCLAALLLRWLPDGRRQGRDWVARNPLRADRSPGSFRIDIQTGKWVDFATGDRGGDPVSLAAYLFGMSQSEAASHLRAMLGMGGDV
ncbi:MULTISPECIES: hypothetical protein [Acetobacter]|uniref:hypothetical protein n=1 Tax=Acetobacter TaxID=434 RepID=UPI000A3BC0E7|nr:MULTISPECIES: hypothetical protein [Acetobacter]MBS1003524.1 hypothetical protein [Acetobacter thailandicus]OUJ09184.1 hypothetical protein HK25_12165 [Acetobacter sp. DsW_059]